MLSREFVRYANSPPHETASRVRARRYLQMPMISSYYKLTSFAPDFSLDKHAVNLYNCDLVSEFFFSVQNKHYADFFTLESAINSQISEDELELLNIKIVKYRFLIALVSEECQLFRIIQMRNKVCSNEYILYSHIIIAYFF